MGNRILHWLRTLLLNGVKAMNFCKIDEIATPLWVFKAHHQVENKMHSSSSFHVFRPDDSTIIDHLSWRAIETVPDRLLTGYLELHAAWRGGVILRGLEMVGEWASGGSPGTKRPDSQASGVRVSPGAAVVSDKEDESIFSKFMKK